MTRLKFVSGRRCRIGGVLIEGVIAMLLLATAIAALSRYAVASRQLNVYADQSLTARLNSQNAVERLARTPAEDWRDKSDEIATQLTTETGVPTEISLNKFRVGNADALHATVRCQIGKTENAVVENHTWKVMP